MNTPIFLACVGFLLANLLLGLYKGRNVKTMKDYALANRAMGTGTLMITIFATFVGCRYVTSSLTSAQDATKGLTSAFLTPLAITTASLFLGRVVFPRLLRFKHCYTLGDIMGQHYGPKAQLFTGVISVFASLVMIAAQLVALEGLATLIGIEGYWIILMVGLAITFYTYTGGMRAVAATDILQFALVIGTFVFIAYTILGLTVPITENGTTTQLPLGSVGAYLEALMKKTSDTPHLSLVNKTFWRTFWGTAVVCLTFFTPAIINRVLAARNRPQVRQAFTGFACLFPFLRLLVAFIGFGFLLTFGSGEIKDSQVFDKIQTCFFGGPSLGIKILLMCTLLGVVMSTADSHLNALVVVVVRDILQYKSSKKEPQTEELKHVKKIALIAGLLSIVLSYFFLFYFKAWASTITVLGKIPLGALVVLVFGAAFGIKGNHKTFLYTALLFLGLVAISGTLLWMNKFPFILNTEEIMNMSFRRKLYYVVGPSMLITGLFFFLIHKMIYGRLTWEQPKVKGHAVRQMGGTKAKWRTIFTNPLVWAKDTFARYGNEPTAVGLFVSLSSLARVTISPRLHEGYTMIFTILNLLTVLLCVLLMIRTMWRQPFKSYFPLFYYGVLIYILPFMHMLLFLYQPQSIILMMQLAMSIILLHLLVDWRSYCFFTLIGWGLAGIVYGMTYLVPEKPIDETLPLKRYDLIWIGFVTLVTVLAIGFLFCSRQEQINTQRLMRTKVYAAGFGHDLLNLYQAPQSTIDHVQTAYQQGVKKDLVNQEAQEWDDMARYMQECAAQAKAFKRLVKFDYIPQSEMKTMSIKALMEKAYSLIPSFRRDGVRIAASKDFQVEVFPPFVNNIILNLVKNAQVHGNAKEVVLSWGAATRRLYIKDNGSGIPSAIVSKIGDLYMTSSEDGTGSGIGLPFVFMVVQDIFQAQIDFATSDKGTTFWIEFPPIKHTNA